MLHNGIWLVLLASIILKLAWVEAAPAAVQTACPTMLTTRIPPRPAQAMTGSEFVAHVAGLSNARRETAALSELLAGNLPTFLRTLKPVRLQYTFNNGQTHSVIICVMPDYLAIGSQADSLRMPMNFYSAITLARRFGFILPTRKIVDAIVRQADYRLRPEPMAPGPQMHSTAYYREHNRKIRTQRLALGYPLGAFVAGHKKDVVLTNRLFQNAGRIAIYGWHRLTDRPIQPLSTVHGARYEDYSHGIRLVSDLVQVDGEIRSIYEILQHPELAYLLSREGVIHDLHRLMGFGS